MRNILFICLNLLTIGLLCSCGNLDEEIVKNREQLPKLRLGMTRERVKELLGEPIAGLEYCKPDIWFYYTDCKWSDFMITKDETTPIVFKDNKVIGWGQDYYKNHFMFEKWD